MLDLSWLTSIRLYGTKENIALLFIGTKYHPRSTVCRIDQNQVFPPQLAPLSTLEILDTKYPYRGDNALKKITMSQEIKLVLSIILREKIKLYHSKNPKINSVLSSSGLSTKTNESIKVYLVEYYEVLNQFNMTSDKNIGLPITIELIKWMNNEENTIELEIEAFIRIMGSSNRQSRQQGLQKLVGIKSPSSEALIILLSRLRSELRQSIYRELGRQKRLIVPQAKLAEEIIQDIDHEDIKYSFLYLTALNSKATVNHSIQNNLEMETSILSKLPLNERFNRIKSLLSKDILIARKSFIGYIFLSKYFPHNFSKQIIGHYHYFPVMKKDRVKIRSALMYILKYAEIMENPDLLGGILCLSSMGRSIKFVGNHDDNDLRIIGGPHHFVMTYVMRRTIKQLELWDNTNRETLVDKSLLFYICHSPLEKVITLDCSNPVNLGIHVNYWIKKHPILKKYDQRIIKLINEDEILLGKTLFNAIKQQNLLVIEWLLQHLGNDQITNLLDQFTINEKLWSFVVLDEIISLQPYRKKLLNERIEETVEWDFLPQTEGEIEKTLEFFSITKNFMPNEIFQIIVSKIFNGDFSNIKLLISYLTKLQKNADTQFHGYFNLIADFIKQKLMINLENQVLIEFIMNLVMRWEHITKTSLSFANQSVLDLLRVIFDDKLSEGKLETWNQLSIETIIATLRVFNSEIHRVIEANIQYSLTKPNWDQLARYFLAMGLERPSRNALKNSQLRKVPKKILQDILGQISLVHETINYCGRNGFTLGLENLIIQNVYKRGWNIDRSLDKSIKNLMGNVSPRLRSYFAVYQVLEKADVDDEILKLARNVDNFQLRERLIKSLGRFATSHTWVIIAESIYDDITEEAIEQLIKTRMLKKERIQLIIRLIQSTKNKLRDLGIKWMGEHNLIESVIPKIIGIPFSDIWEPIIEYSIENLDKFTDDQKIYLYRFIEKLIWTPRIRKKLRKLLYELTILLSNSDDIKTSAIQSLSELADSLIIARSYEVIQILDKFN